MCTIKKSALYLHSQSANGSVAQLNRVLDYGSSGYRFESCRSHLILKRLSKKMTAFFCVYFSRFRVVLVQMCKPMCKPKNHDEYNNRSSSLHIQKTV